MTGHRRVADRQGSGLPSGCSLCRTQSSQGRAGEGEGRGQIGEEKGLGTCDQVAPLRLT